MSSAVLVIAPERFRDEELAEPLAALSGAACDVTIASTRGGTARGILGAQVRVDRTIRQISNDPLDILALVGGAGSPDHLWTHEPLLSLVRRQAAGGGVLAAICLSGAVLARAGVLAGRRATVYPAARALLELKRGGAVYVDEPVVRDGMILTASGPEAATAFGQVLASFLQDG